MRPNNTLEKLCTLIKMNGNHDRIAEYAYMALFLKYCSYLYKYNKENLDFHEFASGLSEYIYNFEQGYVTETENVDESLIAVKCYCNENNIHLSSFVQSVFLYVGSIEMREKYSIMKFLNSLSFDEVVKAINSKESNFYSNNIVDDSVYKLVLKLSEIMNIETNIFFDLNSINGNSLINIASQFNKVVGIVDNECNYFASMCRLIVNKTKSTLIYSREFNLRNFTNNYSVDILFGNFNERLRRKTSLLEDSYKEQKRLLNFANLEEALKHVNENGVVMGIVPLSSLKNYSELESRESLIYRGYIKGVILLPKRIASYTLSEIALVILSKKESENIFMFDASSYFIPEGRYQNAIDVERLMNKINDILMNGNPDYFVHRKKIVLNDFCLLPSRTIISDPVFKDSITLENVAEVFTGWQVGSLKLEKLKTLENEGIELLQASNIDEDGLLTELNKYAIPSYTVSNYKLEPYDILLSTKSSKPKIYMVESLGDRVIVPFGSFVVIRPYLDKIDPYFLECFLQSDEGQKVIKNFQTGSLISNLSVGNVKQIPVPNIPINRQVHIGERYKINKTTILMKLKRIKELKLRNKMLISKEFEMYDL